MESKELIRCLHLMADTIEDLEITGVISCTIVPGGGMSMHLNDLTLSGVDATWTKRLNSNYPWEKSCTYKGITFYAIYTEEEYQKEISKGEVS